MQLRIVAARSQSTFNEEDEIFSEACKISFTNNAEIKNVNTRQFNREEENSTLSHSHSNIDSSSVTEPTWGSEDFILTNDAEIVNENIKQIGKEQENLTKSHNSSNVDSSNVTEPLWAARICDLITTCQNNNLRIANELVRLTNQVGEVNNTLKHVVSLLEVSSVANLPQHCSSFARTIQSCQSSSAQNQEFPSTSYPVCHLPSPKRVNPTPITTASPEVTQNTSQPSSPSPRSESQASLSSQLHEQSHVSEIDLNKPLQISYSKVDPARDDTSKVKSSHVFVFLCANVTFWLLNN